MREQTRFEKDAAQYLRDIRGRLEARRQLLAGASRQLAVQRLIGLAIRQIDQAIVLLSRANRETDAAAPPPPRPSATYPTPAIRREARDYLAQVTTELLAMRQELTGDPAYSAAVSEIDEAVEHLECSRQALPGQDEATTGGSQVSPD